MKHPQLDEILTKLRRHLEAVYGDRLVKVILFGSQARGDATPDSDIDVLIVLQSPFDWPTEYGNLSTFIADLCLEYGTVVSDILMAIDDFQDRNTPLLLNVRREGIAL